MAFPWRHYKQTKWDIAARDFGLYGWADPQTDGNEGRPTFWKVMPTLDATLIARPGHSGDSTLGDLLDLITKRKGEIAGLSLLDGDLILRIRVSEVITQIRISGGKKKMTLDKSILLHLPLSSEARILHDNLRSIGRYLHPHKKKRGRVHPADIISAMKGMHRGYSHKQIAEAIFGAERVKEEWDDSKSIRDDTNYRIKLAREIEMGGFMEYASGQKRYSRNP